MCLPNGLSSGPRKFTKLLKPPLATLRRDKDVVSAYIDDLIRIARNYKMCSNNVFSVVNLLDSLGFVVHPEKSQFIPSQKLEYLGFVIDSVNMTVTMTSRKKKQGIKELCMQLLDTPHPTIRFIAVLLGKFTSRFTAV